MNRDEYLRALSRELRKLPRDEFERAMEYYTEYFDEAGPENVQYVIDDLGEPRDVAKEIIVDAALKRMDEPVKSVKKGFSSVWIVILSIFAAPIALPIAIMLAAALGMVIVAGAAAVIALLLSTVAFVASGLVAVVSGIYLLFHTLPSGLAVLGLGMLITGTGILGTMVMIFIIKWIFRGIRALFRRIIRRGKKNEHV